MRSQDSKPVARVFQTNDKYTSNEAKPTRGGIDHQSATTILWGFKLVEAADSRKFRTAAGNDPTAERRAKSEKTMLSIRQIRKWFRSGLWKQNSRPVIEALQDRCLLSASNLVVEPKPSVSPLSASSAPAGYTPAQIKTAYGFSSSSTAGAGETIATIGVSNDPGTFADLTPFDTQFGLAAPPILENTGEMGNTSLLPPNNASWDVGSSPNVEGAHVISPDANLLLAEGDSSSLNDLLTADDYGKKASIAPTMAAIAAATSHDAVNLALLFKADSFAGVAYQGFESSVDGVSWAIPSSAVDEPAFRAEAQESSYPADQSFQTGTLLTTESAPVAEMVVEGNLDTLNLSSFGSSRVLASALLAGSSARATDVYSMALNGMNNVVTLHTASFVASGSDQNESGTTLSVDHRLASVASHPFSTAAALAVPCSGHFSDVLLAVAGGAAVAALLVRQREPKTAQTVDGFIYDLDR